MSHPNKAEFIGVLTLVATPSDKAPSGARGHRVELTRAAARAAIPSLLGMPVNCAVSLDGHDVRHKIGIIDSAEIRGHELLVSGYLFKRDFPDVVASLMASADPLGMSYELADARVDDMRATVWDLTCVTFTGAAILLKSKAAYSMTDFVLL
jgi:hypothetical protein